ncbi:Alpha-1,6-mannosylglycoprotein 6-beta-N-acetylglucosaminyltransferase B [Plecturocebus cupreus]
MQMALNPSPALPSNPEALGRRHDLSASILPVSDLETRVSIGSVPRCTWLAFPHLTLLPSSQDFCTAPGPAPPGAHARQSPFVLAPNATHLEWAQNASLTPGAWPPVNSLRAWLAVPGRACTDTCLDHGLICEPSFFPLLNSQDAFLK